MEFPERPNFAMQLVRINSRIGTALNDALAHLDLDAGEYAVVSTIGVFGPVRPTRLAEYMGMPPTSLSTRLSRLEARGLVVRSRNAADGRSWLLGLSPEGRRKMDVARPIFLELLATIEGELGRPLEDVQDALADLERAVLATAQGSAPPTAPGARQPDAAARRGSGV